MIGAELTVVVRTAERSDRPLFFSGIILSATTGLSRSSQNSAWKSMGSHVQAELTVTSALSVKISRNIFYMRDVHFDTNRKKNIARL